MNALVSRVTKRRSGALNILGGSPIIGPLAALLLATIVFATQSDKFLTGGNFSLAGGFWSLLSVVQTPGAPLLTITLTSTNTAMVSWPFPSTGFALQQNTNLNMTNWVSPSETVTNNGTINFIIVNPPGGNRFFRLSKP